MFNAAGHQFVNIPIMKGKAFFVKECPEDGFM